MNQEDIRRDQQRVGRSYADNERTVHTKPFRPRHASNKKPQGHEAHLKLLETSKASITITLLDGTKVSGLVRHSDHYTISIKPTGKGTIVYYKHAIESFEPIDDPLTPETSQSSNDE